MPYPIVLNASEMLLQLLLNFCQVEVSRVSELDDFQNILMTPRVILSLIIHRTFRSLTNKKVRQQRVQE